MRGLSSMNGLSNIWCRAAFLGLCLILAASLSQSRAYRDGLVLSPEEWRERVRAAGLDPADIADPLSITPEMAQRAHEVAGSGSRQAQLIQLQRYLFDEAQFRFDYEVLSTLTAEQAFLQRRGNCVSFTNLFITLARSLGSDAHAALAFGIPDKEMVGELILVSSHLVATVRDNRGRTVYDFQRNRTGVLVGFQPIDDLRLTAIYLNNRGVENFLIDRLDEARHYLETSVQLVPDFADAYSNLAVVHRRQGNLDLALDLYILALGIDPDNASLRNNLLVLYGQLAGERRDSADAGLPETSSELEHLLGLGDHELTLGRVTPALEFYRRAARLAPTSAPAHVATARALLVLGNVRKALKSLRRALAVDPDNPDARRLLAGLNRLERR